MRIALLTATALVVLSSLAVAETAVTTPTEKPLSAPKVRATDNDQGGARLHYDVPCRVSPEGTCTIPEPPPYRPKPKS